MNYKERILLHKRYFDIGYGITSYVKVVVAVVGIGGIAAGANKTAIAIMLFLYGLFCYVFGWAFVKYGWLTADIEIGNKFNLFVKEMRKSINRKA